jgi:CPA1 family monovalent cation:H+ antiporter
MTLPDWMLQLAVLLAVAVVLGLLARRVGLPHTVVLAVVGFVAGSFGREFGLEVPLYGETFEEVVVFIFLPPLVFQAALNLSSRDFFRNLLPIVVLAVPALGVSAALIGASLHFGLAVPLAAALLFGALVSATDPVAVVAIFRELGAPKRLLTLIEGESLLNDGVAIVLFNILLVAALGHAVTVSDGGLAFLQTALGGIVLGGGIGFLVAFVLPWLDRLTATAVTVSVAYGGFVIADHLLGVSGVVTTVTAGVVLGGLAQSRASAEVRAVWHEFWEALEYIANAILFLLIGLAIEPHLLWEQRFGILVAVVAVLIARPLAVFPLVSALERIMGIPAVGWRNSLVLVWGGLRGAVSLALALALPETLAQREMFVAMTAAVVLVTLMGNATTIALLMRRLRLGEPSVADRVLAGSAVLSGVQAARMQLEEWGIDDPIVAAELQAVASRTHDDLTQLDLKPAEEHEVVLRQGLFVVRDTYQRLSDAKLLPPRGARKLGFEADDLIDAVSLGIELKPDLPPWHRKQARIDWFALKVLGWLPDPVSTTPEERAYTELSARHIAALQAISSIEMLAKLPNFRDEVCTQVIELLGAWDNAAQGELRRLEAQIPPEALRLQRRYASAIGSFASASALEELVQAGVLPEAVAERATTEVIRSVLEAPRALPAHNSVPSCTSPSAAPRGIQGLRKIR